MYMYIYRKIGFVYLHIIRAGMQFIMFFYILCMFTYYTLLSSVRFLLSYPCYILILHDSVAIGY